MKRLLLVALMVLVTLVGMVGVSSAADAAMQSVITQLKNMQQSLDAISYSISALQASANATNTTVSKLQAASNGVGQLKHKIYYLTGPGFTGSSAMTACDSGFHMATIYEFRDPGNLQYATRPTPAYDSPYDSPVYDQGLDLYPTHTGWVRSGIDQLAALVGDCDIWRSSSDQRLGTMMTRSSLLGEASRSLYESAPAEWWQSIRMASCSQPESVWCVEDAE